MSIVRLSGRWTVNGKRYTNMNEKEKEALSSFITFMKNAYESKKTPKRLTIQIKL